MGDTPFAARLRDVLPASAIEARAPLAPLTTFNVGGPADWLITVATVEELQACLASDAFRRNPAGKVIDPQSLLIQ